MQATVVYVSRFNFNDKDTGRNVQGCKVWYLSAADTDNQNAKGCQPIPLSAPSEAYGFFSEVPGKYDLDIEVKLSGGKAIAVLKNARFISKQPQQ